MIITSEMKSPDVFSDKLITLEDSPRSDMLTNLPTNYVVNYFRGACQIGLKPNMWAPCIHTFKLTATIFHCFFNRL